MSETTVLEPNVGRTPDRDTTRARGRTLPLRVRYAVLTAHIVFSVALLGDSAGYLAVAIRTWTLDDPELIHDSLKTLNMFSLVFGIPLSLGALLTGVALGLGTCWGVFKYPWVTAKLALILSVLLVGAFVIGPASNQMLDGDGDTTASTDRRCGLRRRRVRPSRRDWPSSSPGGRSGGAVPLAPTDPSNPTGGSTR